MRFSATTLPGLLALAAAGAPSGEAAAAPVEVASDRVLLGDLLPGAPAAVASIDLGPAPIPGVTRTVTRAEARRALRRAGVDPDAAATLPARARVRRASRTAEAAELRALIADAVRTALPPGRALAEVRWDRELVVPAGELRAEVASMPDLPSGLTPVILSLAAGDSRPLRVHASVTVDAPVLVRRGDPVAVLARRGVVEAAGRGTAMRDGRAGDTIPVLCGTQRRTVMATVAGDRSVEIAF